MWTQSCTIVPSVPRYMYLEVPAYLGAMLGTRVQNVYNCFRKKSKIYIYIYFVWETAEKRLNIIWRSNASISMQISPTPGPWPQNTGPHLGFFFTLGPKENIIEPPNYLGAATHFQPLSWETLQERLMVAPKCTTTSPTPRWYTP
jgi:hypothetical protein